MAPKTLSQGEAARIFTGAPLPNGADAIVIQENCQLLPDGQAILIQQSALEGKHIRLAGEEVQIGQKLAQIGQKITPGLIGLCAAQGWDTLPILFLPK